MLDIRDLGEIRRTPITEESAVFEEVSSHISIVRFGSHVQVFSPQMVTTLVLAFFAFTELRVSEPAAGTMTTSRPRRS